MQRDGSRLSSPPPPPPRLCQLHHYCTTMIEKGQSHPALGPGLGLGPPTAGDDSVPLGPGVAVASREPAPPAAAFFFFFLPCCAASLLAIWSNCSWPGVSLAICLPPLAPPSCCFRSSAISAAASGCAASADSAESGSSPSPPVALVPAAAALGVPDVLAVADADDAGLAGVVADCGVAGAGVAALVAGAGAGVLGFGAPPAPAAEVRSGVLGSTGVLAIAPAAAVVATAGLLLAASLEPVAGATERLDTWSWAGCSRRAGRGCTLDARCCSIALSARWNRRLDRRWQHWLWQQRRTRNPWSGSEAVAATVLGPAAALDAGFTPGACPFAEPA